MNPVICISACSLIYCMLMINVSKKMSARNNQKNKYFKLLLFLNFLGLILEVSGFFLGNQYNELKIINTIVFKLMLIIHVCWSTMLLFYVMTISNDNKINKKLKILIYILMIIGSIVSIILEIKCNIKNNIVMNTYGPAVDFVYYYCFVMMLTYLLVLFKNIKKANAYKYSPIFLFIVGGVIASMIQSYYPELVLSTSVDTFVIYSVYFTIEQDALLCNQDQSKK